MLQVIMFGLLLDCIDFDLFVIVVCIVVVFTCWTGCFVLFYVVWLWFLTCLFSLLEGAVCLVGVCGLFSLRCFDCLRWVWLPWFVGLDCFFRFLMVCFLFRVFMLAKMSAFLGLFVYAICFCLLLWLLFILGVLFCLLWFGSCVCWIVCFAVDLGLLLAVVIDFGV